MNSVTTINNDCFLTVYDPSLIPISPSAFYHENPLFPLLQSIQGSSVDDLDAVNIVKGINRPGRYFFFLKNHANPEEICGFIADGNVIGKTGCYTLYLKEFRIFIASTEGNIVQDIKEFQNEILVMENADSLILAYEDIQRYFYYLDDRNKTDEEKTDSIAICRIFTGDVYSMAQISLEDRTFSPKDNSPFDKIAENPLRKS